MLPPRAYLFIALNAARALSLLTLILVFSSSIVTMAGDIAAIRRSPADLSQHNSTISINGTDYIFDCDYRENSTVPMQPGGSMFAIINHIFIIFQIILLFMSEISWPMSFLDNFVPVLGTQHGVGILGFMQIFIGAAVLSHHVGTFALVSAFFLFAIGILNVLLGLTFRASIRTKRSLTSWRDRVPELPRSTSDFKSAMSGKGSGVFGAAQNVFANVTGSSEKNQEPGSHPGYGFGRQGEKQAGLKGFLISKPVETLPRYAAKPGAPSRNSSRSSNRSSADSTEIPIQDPPKANRI
ncbi:uncharacterized protein EI90DRAFT_3144762 [Cantharellus anzutake]|uniref:uncharacterized protein n=1 Tax=Cantharellus anzutake TaxID=1750568 RepID=UPI001905E540|nr:uncharacterized protein EI90DRAFT_3144762 [Cantharellus anzutake]KAF8335728.1 hypothetical protein EI90DRAFT_3144762 [Cantharellus anzutake]